MNSKRSKKYLKFQKLIHRYKIEVTKKLVESIANKIEDVFLTGK